MLSTCIANDASLNPYDTKWCNLSNILTNYSYKVIGVAIPNVFKNVNICRKLKEQRMRTSFATRHINDG